MQSNQDSAAGGDTSQTVEVPLSACPDCKQGDKLSFTVVSVDQNSGTITMTPDENEAQDQAGGSDDLANQVGDEEPPAEQQ